MRRDGIKTSGSEEITRCGVVDIVEKMKEARLR